MGAARPPAGDDYGYEATDPAARRRAREQDLAVNAAADVRTETPLIRPECRLLGQHEIVFNGLARCGCASVKPPLDEVEQARTRRRRQRPADVR